jgi:hypothetical protein
MGNSPRGPTSLQLVRDTLRSRSFDGIRCCKMPSEIDGVPAKVAASVGITTIEGDETDFAPAIARAGAALYRARHAGRNRLEIDRPVARACRAKGSQPTPALLWIKVCSDEVTLSPASWSLIRRSRSCGEPSDTKRNGRDKPGHDGSADRTGYRQPARTCRSNAIARGLSKPRYSLNR